MINIDPTKLTITRGIQAMQGKGFDSVEDDYLFAPVLGSLVNKEFEKQPDECVDGGNDKHFFTVEFRGTKLFVVENEVGGLTIMLPDEY